MTISRTSVRTAEGRQRLLPVLQLAAQEVFELMLACPLEMASETPPRQGLEITSMVGLAGQLSGILSLRCSARSAAHMASRMLGIDPATAGPEMWDAVGEICNMVAGNFKNKINGLGDACLLSVPTVITGADYIPQAMSDHLQVSFRFGGEPVVISLEVHN